MMNADEAQAEGYGRQIVDLDYQIERAQERITHLRRMKGEAIERLLEVRSRIMETR